MKRFLLIVALLVPLLLLAQEVKLERVEPPNWWTGFKNPEVQLMVYGKNIATTTVSVDYPGFVIKKIHKTDNPNYLFLDMTISPGTRPGLAVIQFKSKDKVAGKYLYELNERKKGSAPRKSFNASDVIYLLMPDRFSNGDTTNDNCLGMLENADRSNPDGRHGGDLQGITNHLDYLKDLGVTALWLNPFQENNQEKYSYHGYSITNYYLTDPRIGTNEEFAKLCTAIHKKGMKVIMDQILNHCGSNHWWMKDLPSPDWINQWPEFTRSNYRAGTVSDPYVSTADSNLYVRGWFDKTMPDLNQRNPYLKQYLIQNSIWWIEYAGLDGIRHDTHPYPFKDVMSEWGQRILEEYPGFNIVGECWMNYPSNVAYWQKDALNKDHYNSWLPSVFDFPLYDALTRAFNEPEGWNTGILRLYEILSQDMVYPDPGNLVVFADNHDVNRCLDTQNDDVRKLKMALAFVLTTRGIPQIYYGSEILMTTGADKGHGSIRKDFPGGWPSDTQNKFTAAGRTPAEQEMFDYVKNLLTWRQSSDVVHTGKLLHFIPENGIYVYFRYNAKDAVMVVLNNNEETRHLDTKRFREVLDRYHSGTDVINGGEIGDLSLLAVPSKSALIIDLRK